MFRHISASCSRLGRRVVNRHGFRIGDRSRPSVLMLRCSSTSPDVSQSMPDLPQLISFENGQRAEPTFSRMEMARRLAALRDHMSAHDIGGVLLTSMHNVKYFSDYLYCSLGRPYGLVITMDRVVNIASKVDGGQAWRRSPISDDVIIYTDWQRDNFWRAVQQELGGVSGKIGAEFDHIPHEWKLKLDHCVTPSPTVDVGVPTMKIRMIKSDEEIAVIHEGARIADIGGEAAKSASVEGAAEFEIVRHATDVMVREVAKAYPESELRDTWAWMQTGPVNSDGAHNYPTTRRLQKGDIMVLNVFPMIAGYFAALERTLFFDHVTSDRHLELWELNCEVHRRGMALVQPGARCCDIARELNEIYRERDLLGYKSFGYGHSMGIISYYYGREAGELDMSSPPEMT